MSKRKLDSCSSNEGDTEAKIPCTSVSGGVSHLHNNDLFKCEELNENGEICNMEFRLLYHLDQHRNKSCGFTCGIVDQSGNKCVKWSQRKFSIVRHRLLHNNTRRVHEKRRDFQCSETKADGEKCSQSFYDARDLARHVEGIHWRQKNSVCNVVLPNGEICPKAYRNAGSLSKHKQSVHLGKFVECATILESGEVCKLTFTREASRQKHINVIHLGIKPFVCDFVLEDGSVCNHAHATRLQLTEHMRTHSGEKPFKCTYEGCDYCCALKEGLNAHIRTHTGEKPYKCTDANCDYASATRSNLAEHIRIWHSEEGQRRHRVKEQRVMDLLVSSSIRFERECYVNFRCCATDSFASASSNSNSFAKPIIINSEHYFSLADEAKKQFAKVDAVIYTPNCIIALEVDEHQHLEDDSTPWGYTVSCDAARMNNVQVAYTMAATAANEPVQPILWIRFNPDTFKIDGVRGRVSLRDREQRLLEVIRTFQPAEKQAVSILYMYYDIESVKIERDEDSAASIVEKRPVILSHDDYDKNLAKCVLPPVFK